jgi:hypothetical protein
MAVISGLACLWAMLLLLGAAASAEVVITSSERKVCCIEWERMAIGGARQIWRRTLTSGLVSCADEPASHQPAFVAAPHCTCRQVNLKSQIAKVTDNLEVLASGAAAESLLLCYPTRLAERQARLRVRRVWWCPRG